MGHWSDSLLNDVSARVGPGADSAVLKELLRKAASEIELLSGRTFGEAHQRSESINSGGLPFVEVGDAHVAGFTTDHEVWPIPDPVNPHLATVVQLVRPAEIAGRAAPAGQALWVAGQFLARSVQAKRLDPWFMLWWLGKAFEPEQRMEYLRQAFDPAHRLFVPIAGASFDGWWFQISRRLRWLTRDSGDDHRLVQPLNDDEDSLSGLVGGEPVLIIARMTEHPTAWAIAFRIWHNVARDAKRPWRYAAAAIHQHGVPILSIDEGSTANEIACQLVLLAYWHKYIGQDQPVIDEALAAAYPKAVERVRRGAQLPDLRSAAAVLLEGLLHPGFDPAQGAESARRYVSRKATIAVMEHRKLETPGLREWERLGLTERSYYKLLRRLIAKRGRRYDLDEEERARIRKHVDMQTQRKARHDAAMHLLQERGFSYGAARKWLQRHAIEEVVHAHPRGRSLRAVAS